MKSALIALLIGSLASLAGAQGDPIQGLSSLSTERARIEATRQRETAVFDAQAAQCYDRFAVNDCLHGVLTKRRAVLSELKRQESVLNDAERMQRGAAQLRLGEQKALEKLERDREAALIDNDAVRAERQQAQDEKRRDNANVPLNASSTPRTLEPATPPADSAESRASAQRKLEDAQKRRLEVEKRLKDKAGSKPVKPLPLPP